MGNIGGVILQYLPEALNITAPIAGAAAGASAIKKGQKQIEGIYKNNAKIIDAERSKKALNRMENIAILADAKKKARKLRKQNSALSSMTGIPINESGAENFYADAIGKIASSTMARRMFLDELSRSNRDASIAQKNEYNDAKSKAWASASDAAIKVAQKAFKAGDVASKDATLEEPNTPNNTGLWNDDGTHTGNMEELASHLGLKRAELPTELRWK